LFSLVFALCLGTRAKTAPDRLAVALSVQNVAAAILVYRNFGLLTIPGMAGRSRRDE
jgi:hypothetical protein